MREPTDLQAKILRLPQQWRAGGRLHPLNIAMLGGRGSGKSTSELQEALRHVVEHAGTVWFFRRSFPAAKELEERLVSLFTVAIPGSRYSYTEHILRCPNGGSVEVCFLEGEADYGRYQGRECTLLLIDEITLWPSLTPIFRLRSSLRSAKGIPTRTVIAGNPGGPGHSAVASKFVTGRPLWTPFELEPGGNDWWVLVGGSMADNEHLPAGYADTLRAACAGDSALLAAWLEGSFEAVGGSFFGSQFGEHSIMRGGEDWRPSTEGWSTYWAIDWGISAPAVALGMAKARERGLQGPDRRTYPKGSRIVVCEVTSADPSDISRGQNWSVDILAEEMRGASERFGIKLVGCVDDARGLGADETVVSEFRRCGVSLQRAVKGSRASGWTKLKNMMMAAKVVDPDAPWTAIHERCRFSIETVACLPRDPRRLDDCDTSANDHAADAWRMGVLYAVPASGVTPFLPY